MGCSHSNPKNMSLLVQTFGLKGGKISSEEFLLRIAKEGERFFWEKSGKKVAQESNFSDIFFLSCWRQISQEMSDKFFKFHVDS